jgi:hypothetical protein
VWSVVTLHGWMHNSRQYISSVMICSVTQDVGFLHLSGISIINAFIIIFMFYQKKVSIYYSIVFCF